MDLRWLEVDVRVNNEDMHVVMDDCNHMLACDVDELLEDELRRRFIDANSRDRVVAGLIAELLNEQVNRRKGMWRRMR